MPYRRLGRTGLKVRKSSYAIDQERERERENNRKRERGKSKRGIRAMATKKTSTSSTSNLLSPVEVEAGLLRRSREERRCGEHSVPQKGQGGKNSSSLPCLSKVLKKKKGLSPLFRRLGHFWRTSRLQGRSQDHASRQGSRSQFFRQRRSVWSKRQSGRGHGRGSPRARLASQLLRSLDQALLGRSGPQRHGPFPEAHRRRDECFAQASRSRLRRRRPGAPPRFRDPYRGDCACF